jgi:hypothetical protein
MRLLRPASLVCLAAAGWLLPVPAVAQLPPPPRYERTAPLALRAETLTATLGKDGVGTLVQDLLAVARRQLALPPALRSRCVAMVLSIRPGERDALVADGQLSRLPDYRPPAPLSEAEAEQVHARIRSAAERLALSAHPDGVAMAAALADLSWPPDAGDALRALTYGIRPDWQPLLLAEPREDAESGDLPTLTNASLRALLPGPQPAILTVTATAEPMPPQESAAPARISLPSPVSENDAAARLTALLRPRHAPWPTGWEARISLSPAPPRSHASLFAAAFAAADGLLSGEAADPACVIALALDDNGVPVPVAAPEVILSSCARSGVRHVILPSSSVAALTDWLLLNPTEWPLLLEVGLHTARSAADVIALSREQLAPLLLKADRQYDVTVAPLRGKPDALTLLRSPAVIRSLEEVTQWHSQHLSAQFLLRIANRSAGGALSPAASLREIEARSGGLRPQPKGALRKGQRGLRKTPFGKAWDDLNAIRGKVHPETREYCGEMLELARLLDRYAGKWPPDNTRPYPDEPPEVTRQRQRLSRIRANLANPPQAPR